MNVVEKADYYLILKIVNLQKFTNEEVGKLANYILGNEEIEKILKMDPIGGVIQE